MAIFALSVTLTKCAQKTKSSPEEDQLSDHTADINFILPWRYGGECMVRLNIASNNIDNLVGLR